MTTVARLLRESGLAAADARVLLRHVLGWSPAQLASRADASLPPPLVAAFGALVSRRAVGEPVAYITGEREFYGLMFKVTPAVLIPRPETELLVELALERIPPDTPCRVLDLGTGSGCVALAIASQRPQARITATDCSQDALNVAAANAHALGVRNIEFARGDWFDAPDIRHFDLIVSNPPYIAAGDLHLGQGDLRFEPRGALAAGADGLDCIRTIVRGASTRLSAGGWLLFEHGYDQARVCRELLRITGFGAVCSRPDLAGIARVSGGSLLDDSRHETLN
ncbi:MAG: peptide chain release factor N(5)-glutamine methyltransferase [Pseudomonadota bacterium]